MTGEETGTFINSGLEKPTCVPEVDGAALPLRVVDSTIPSGPLPQLRLSNRAHRDNPEVHKLNHLFRVSMAVRPVMFLMIFASGKLDVSSMGTTYIEFSADVQTVPKLNPFTVTVTAPTNGNTVLPFADNWFSWFGNREVSASVTLLKEFSGVP